MNAAVSRMVLLYWMTLSVAGTAAAGSLTGVVRNATAGRLVPGQEVTLMQLRGGMEAVAMTKSDAQGRYRFDHPAIGQGPMLVRVNYRGVNYHQSVPPGRDSADIEIFESTDDPSALQVASRTIVLQPNGPTLMVGEEYSVHNHSKPPMALYKPAGTFEFYVPEGGELAQVSAWGPSGMPLVQGTIEKGKNRYAIAFPFRPGQSGVRLSYQLSYPGNQLRIRAFSPLAVQRVLLIAPPTMQVVGEGFEPAGSEQGWNIYAREQVPAGSSFEFSVAGTAPAPSAPEAQQPPQASDASGQPVGVMPGRLDELKWILIFGFGALFALGAIFLWRRPRREALVSATAEVDREVRQGLDEIKETLFRLELRKQAGTISEEEYAQQRGGAEKMLRKLLR